MWFLKTTLEWYNLVGTDIDVKENGLVMTGRSNFNTGEANIQELFTVVVSGEIRHNCERRED